MFGLMQAVNRSTREGFRFATYAIWWIKALFRTKSCDLVACDRSVPLGTRKAVSSSLLGQAKIAALDNADCARAGQGYFDNLGVKDQEVVDMNRRLGGDASAKR